MSGRLLVQMRDGVSRILVALKPNEGVDVERSTSLGVRPKLCTEEATGMLHVFRPTAHQRWDYYCLVIFFYADKCVSRVVLVRESPVSAGSLNRGCGGPQLYSPFT